METSSSKRKNSYEDDEAYKKKKYTSLRKRKYIVRQTIGGGYCGIVKLAESKVHGCDVAVKIVSKFSAPSEYLKKFFPREIEAVRGLTHPNIIKYYQSIETTHRIYIIMEYAVNGNLFDYIKSHVYVDEVQSKIWFQQLCNAIEYCQSCKIAHRDIKCENILLDEYFNIKLSDFGFARSVFVVNNHVGLVSTFCGSYAYVAPEILKGQPYNPMISDVWSMGVVLYAMVLGCLPFDDTNYFVLLKQVRNDVNFPEKPEISDNLRALIVRILKPRQLRPTLAEVKADVWLTSPRRVSVVSDTISEDVAVESLEPIKDNLKTDVSKTDVSESLSHVLSENTMQLGGGRDYSYLVSRDSDTSEHMEMETDLDVDSAV